MHVATPVVLKSFGLFEDRQRGVSSRSVLMIPVYNPTAVAPLIDGDFRRFPDRELSGHEYATTDFWALNRSKSRKKCCKLLHGDFSPVLGGGLEPPRLTAYAPQTYVSAISPPERCGGGESVARTHLPASDSC